MSQRDDGVPRRLRWGAMLATVLVLGGGTTAAQAFWQSRVPLAAGVVASGDLALATQWVGSWSAWKPLYPSGVSDTATLRVTATGSGTTLRWKLSATPTMQSTWVTTQVFVGACGSGTVIPPGGSYAPAGGLKTGQSVDLCLRVTLRADAPSTAQNTAISPSMTVTADQVLS